MTRFQFIWRSRCSRTDLGDAPLELPPRRGVTSRVRDALELSVVTRWGTSVLETRTIAPPTTFTVARGSSIATTIAVDVDRSGVVRIEGAPIAMGESLELEVGELTIEVTLDRSEGVAIGKPPFDRPAIASQTASLLIHAATLASAIAFLPATEHEEDVALEREALASLTAAPSAETASSTERELPNRSANADTESARSPAEGSSARRGLRATSSSIASRAQRRGLALESRSEPPAIDPASFGILNLITVAGFEPPHGGFADLPSGSDAFAGAAGMWGSDVGDGSSAAGLGLSGIGEGGGGMGRLVGLGTRGSGRGIIGACDASCMEARRHDRGGTSGSPLGDGHRPALIDICGVSGTAEGAPHEANACHGRSSGRLPPAVIQRVVHQSFRRFRHCYEQALKPQPSLVGRVTVRFVIGRDGTVSSAQDGGSDLPDREVVACVVRAFGTLSFPEPEDGVVTVVYPVTFSSGD